MPLLRCCQVVCSNCGRQFFLLAVCAPVFSSEAASNCTIDQVWFEERFWDDTAAFGYVPTSTAPSPDNTTPLGGHFAEIVNCEPMTGQPILMALLGPPYAQHAEDNLTDTDVVSDFLAVARRLADFTPGWGKDKPLPDVVTTLVTRWQADRFACGAYSYLPVRTYCIPLHATFRIASFNIVDLSLGGHSSCNWTDFEFLMVARYTSR